jgi:hypothetical protein
MTEQGSGEKNEQGDLLKPAGIYKTLKRILDKVPFDGDAHYYNVESPEHGKIGLNDYYNGLHVDRQAKPLEADLQIDRPIIALTVGPKAYFIFHKPDLVPGTFLDSMLKTAIQESAPDAEVIVAAYEGGQSRNVEESSQDEQLTALLGEVTAGLGSDNT